MMLSRSIRRIALASLALIFVSAGLLLAPFFSTSAHADSTITIDGSTSYQTMDGFGISEAFGQASSLKNAPVAQQQQILDLLFNTSDGAGLTILRNIVPSDSGDTIEPNNPGSPTAPPQYTWNNNDEGQVWFSQQALKYGVNQFYADAWSAPGFMKTNNDEANGGTLCGVPDTSCGSGDWRQSYANYLVQYLHDYQSAGITIPYVGFVNEPDFTPNYSSMSMSPAQNADFIKVLGPAVASSGLPTRLVCCDATGWSVSQGYINAITSDSTANSLINVFSSHGYSSPPDSPAATNGKPAWETEWSTFDNFDPSWDDGSDAAGFTWAQHIYTGLTAANLSAFFYWWGVSTGTDNQQLVQLNGTTVIPTGRLWAFANYSRFIRPGAVRIGDLTSDSTIQTTAFLNANGSVVIVALNSATTDNPVTFSLQNLPSLGSSATPYLTNNTSNTAGQPAITLSSGMFNATVPARSLVTYVIPAASSRSVSTLPGTWTQCATEYNTCNFSGTRTVAFGANGLFNYATLTNGTSCSASVFGDPDKGVVKVCYLEALPPATDSWSQCAAEDATCSFSGTMTVAFGVNEQFHYATLTNGTPCTTSVFGDPAKGVVKACYLIAPPPNAATWTQCAIEYGTCSFTGTQDVAFGGNGQFLYQNLNNGTACSASVFGDPTAGMLKSCYYETAGLAPPPTPTLTPTPTQNAGASCQVQYTVANQWSGGFTANIAITNTGSTAINGWMLTFAFPNGQQIYQIWNGSYTQQGSQITITDAGYNSSIPINGSTSLGFNANWTTSNDPPISFLLNGSLCQ